MTHSVKKQKQRENIKRKLNQRIKAIKQLSGKHEKEKQTIYLPNAALGDLRRRFSPRHKALHPAIKRMVSKFRRYPVDRSKVLEVYGSDGGLLLVRSHFNDSEGLKELEKMVKELPRTKDYKFKGINRGDYLTVHLGSWAPYAKECLITRETRDMGVEGIQFLKKNEKIWSEMSRIL